MKLIYSSDFSEYYSNINEFIKDYSKINPNINFKTNQEITALNTFYELNSLDFESVCDALYNYTEKYYSNLKFLLKGNKEKLSNNIQGASVIINLSSVFDMSKSSNWFTIYISNKNLIIKLIEDNKTFYFTVKPITELGDSVLLYKTKQMRKVLNEIKNPVCDYEKLINKKYNNRNELLTGNIDKYKSMSQKIIKKCKSFNITNSNIDYTTILKSENAYEKIRDEMRRCIFTDIYVGKSFSLPFFSKGELDNTYLSMV